MIYPQSSRTCLSVEMLENRNLLSKATMAVAVGILKSPEEFNHFVIREYQHLLGRLPDSTGQSHFIMELETGATRETVEAELASSKEYALLHASSVASYVTALYQDLLGRTPSAFEIDTWSNALANGTSPFTVAKAIGTSLERDIALIRSDYTQFLGRSPRTDEIVAWLDQFQAGADRTKVEAGIIASDEFFAQAGKDPSTFVTHVYQDLFLRTPAQSEINFWVNVYNQNKP